MNALISINYTYDFVAEDEKLTTGIVGQVIEKKLTAHIKKFVDQKDFVVFAIDTHNPKDSSHPESRLFPPHNVTGTDGRELYGSLKSLYRDYEQEKNIYWIDKQHYSAFSGADLDICLQERQIADIYLTGVCTDICMLYAVVDTYSLGHKLYILKDAMAGFDPVGHEWILRCFEFTLGAEIL